MSQLRLPPRGRLTPTGPVDAIERYHSLGFGWVLRRRLRWVLDRLEGAGRQRVLEIGYGSGILMYSLRGMADELVGLDIHENAGMVTRQLARDGITARLTQGDGAVLPFRDGAFDAVIIVSALEFVPDPEACLREAMRVTRPEGRVIAVTPRILRWADRIYQVLVGFDPETEWKGGRVRV